MKRWIAVYTKPRYEKKVHSLLEEKGIESYLPLIRQRRQWSDRKKWVDVPLFRSYIFVHTVPKDSLWVLQTPGVHHIIKFKNEIAFIMDEQIEAIRTSIEGGLKPEATDYFTVGEEVEIIAGPMKGIRGLVAQIKGNEKFILKIDAIQHAMSVHIERNYLRPVK